MSSQLDAALRQFEAAEANLAKLERLWGEIEEMIPAGIAFVDGSLEARAHEDKCRAFRSILPHVPLIDGFGISDCLLELDEIAQMRFDAHEIDTPEGHVATERSIIEQGQVLREYRFRFNAKRRELVRKGILELIDAVDHDLRRLPEIPEAVESSESVEEPEWDTLKDHIRQLETLLGSSFARPDRWSDLCRHLHFGLTTDLRDIKKHDWPSVKGSLQRVLYEHNEPIPVEVRDLEELAVAQPTGPVATRLKWNILSDEEFERVLFLIISNAPGYENPEWLTRTNAPDRGRDLSVIRIIADALSGTRRSRVIIQCKHWLSRSVGIPDVSIARDQMELWTQPTVDVLVIATSGRFTSDAVALIEKHNEASKTPSIEMWPETHLERLLAERPYLIAEFGLR